jgi:hypothetical protein
MSSLFTSTIIDMAGEAGASFSAVVAIGSLLVALVAWELASDIKGPEFKLLKKHLGLSVIPLLFIFLLVIFLGPRQ